MEQRPIWRGHLRLALVTCPVALYAANHDRGSLHFHLINPDTGNRIRSVTLDAGTEDEVPRRELVKGYEYEKDHYLILSDADFESARVESSGTIRIDKFVEAASIDPIYFDASYYLAPDGDAGRDVYAVLRDAITASGVAAMARVVIARRERAIAILPMRDGLVAHTLHEERDLNDPGGLFKGLPAAKSDAEMVQLATQLIRRQRGKYVAADTEDRYEARLREVIAAKLKGRKLTPMADDTPARDNVIDLMGALKRSLGEQEKAGPAKKGHKVKPAAARRPAARRRA